MQQFQTCPTDDTLRDWMLGSCAAPTAETVADHLLACTPCGAELDRLAANDPLLANARAAVNTNSNSTDGTLADEILRRMKTPSNPELAFLGPPLPDHPTDLGTLDRYRVVDLLGQGGMGMVFRAIDSTLHRTVALKVILPKYAENEKLRVRFLEEARATVAVRSAHVAEVYDCGVVNGAPFLTMELLAGVTLDQKPKPMATDSWRRIAYGIAKGLADAHRVSMIHRDLKPSNIHLGTDARTGKPTVKIIDFGLARPIDRATEITKAGELLGTPAYMSPEQARGKTVDHRTDLYSLGVILYQLATGKLPYPGADEGVFAVMADLASPEPLPSVAIAVPDLPPELASLIDRLLAKNPAHRPAHADEVMAVLKASLTTTTTTTTATKPIGRPVVTPDPLSLLHATGVGPVPTVLRKPVPETEPFTQLAAEPRRKPKRTPRWPFAAVGVLVLAFLGLSAAGLFKVKTKDSVIVLAELPEDAEVLVDGEKVTVTWDKGKQKAEVHVKPGTHTVEVKKDGFTATGEEVTLSDGGRKIVTARLEKKAAPVVVVPTNPLPSGELVLNGDCTTTNLDGWKGIKGSWYKALNNHCFCAGDCQEGILQQDIDVSRYAAEIDGAKLEFNVSVQLGSYDNDTSQLKMLFLDKDNRELSLGYDTGEHAHTHTWVPYGKTAAPPTGTRAVQIVLRSRLVPRPGNKHNTGWFDNVSLKAIAKSPPPLRTTIGYQTLFNGKDLTGWSVEGGEARAWAVEDGSIVATAVSPQTPSYLLFDKDSADFTLRFDFQVTDPGAVGAVALRAIIGEKARINNREFSDHPLITLTNPLAGDATGTAYYMKASGGNVPPTAKPQVAVGQWYTCEVTVRGDTCRATFDGQSCVDLQYDSASKPADGFPAGLMRQKGKIGFKAYTGALKFRNIEIRDLAPSNSSLFFNGKDLAGWDGLPGYWHVEDGAIVARIPPGIPAHTFLVSDKKYKDFDLKFQVRRLDGVGNSGLQFRSQVKDAATFKVVGPQVEIDSADFAYPPGSLITEPNLDPLKEKARPEVAKAYKDADFNDYHVRCVGKHVTITVNGVTAIDGDYPSLPDEGVIAWQIHGKMTAKETIFRNIAFTDLSAAAPVTPPADGFVSLFNSKDLTGWEPHPDYPGQWTVKDGVLSGRATATPPLRQPQAYLRTARKDYADFHLRAEARINRGGGGGIYFRVADNEMFPSPKDNRWITGYKVDIEAKKNVPTWTGGLMCGNYILSNPTDTPALPGEWFVMDVIASGWDITIKINDRVVNRYNDPNFAHRSAKGFISLEAYVGASVIEFRKIEIKEPTVTVAPPAIAPPAAPPAVSPPPPVVVAKDDLFVTGSAWRGVKIIEKGDYAGGSGFYELVVDKRTGGTFTGSVVDNGPNRNPATVTGTIDGTKITWKEVPLNNTAHFTTVTGTRDGSTFKATTVGTFGGRGNSGRAVLYRIAAANDTAAEADFHPIFNGRGLVGWETHPAQKDGWKVTQFGHLVGAGTATSHLYTKKDYGDVHVKVRAKVNSGGNSGVYVRSTFGPKIGAAGFPLGYEAQISANLPAQPTGSLFPYGTAVERSKINDFVRSDEWFDLDLVAKGNKFEVYVNGQQSMAYTDPQARAKTGRIALQLHDAKTAVEFALIAVKELK